MRQRNSHTHTTLHGANNPHTRKTTRTNTHKQHDIVPRFSIKNVFAMKDEMDATDWGGKLLGAAKDWAVPDAIEHSAAYKRLTGQAKAAAAPLVSVGESRGREREGGCRAILAARRRRRRRQ